MKRAGDVVGTAQGVLVVRCPDDEFPDPGTTLLDDSLDEIGTVVDVFGPVERPYLAVTPAVDSPARLVGSPLYARS